jgi:hypothetical protein
MTVITFSPDTGTLLAPRDAVRALLADGDVDGLADAGGVADGQLHPALEAARRAASGALATMRLERGGREGAAWAAPDGAAIAVPRPDERWQLSAMPVLYLPDALARLNDVGPRPRIEPAVSISLSAGDLARALASREYDSEPVFAETLARLREHWRIESRWEPAERSAGVRVLEVIDSDAGMWLVIPSDPTVELWPTTPTAVFRLITGLFPRDDELGAVA